MLVAVTNSDETNMVACQVAYSLFNTPNKVARIRSPPIWWNGIGYSCRNPCRWTT